MQNSFVHLALAVLFAFTAISIVYAADTWRDSFDDICGKVSIAGDLNEKELAELIARADKLSPEILKSDDAAKKVYLKRLKSCRGVFEFMLDTKQSEKK